MGEVREGNGGAGSTVPPLVAPPVAAPTPELIALVQHPAVRIFVPTHLRLVADEL